ncbi:ribonuclease P protein subunit p25-like [Mercenaria mercenaria]|uniref:ribonuclease P protein subunit p25-like n=1 Tax=Mercenaria mercenaria TaxID=6596 RepID=UPI00234E6E06|nr:ribonuclease P protein subunit p25-like [Mercenaria mercenaria]XP_053386135.1 ribonuclease P protein subunit p25-like [Mercenaria mercenaria]
MENYEKGEVQEVEEPPVFTLGNKDVHMRVAAGSKIRNLMGYAMKKIKEPDTKQLCWSGSGKAITKTVSCAEIMKRKIKGLHQITEIRKRRVEEYWEPKIEGLERLKVNRDIPAISILLSKEPLDKEHSGYQAPGSFDEFWKDVVQKDKSRSSVGQRSAGGQKRKQGLRNLLLEGAKGSGNDGSRSKANNNNENRKRKFENERKERGKFEGQGQGNRTNPNKNKSDSWFKSGKGSERNEGRTNSERGQDKNRTVSGGKTEKRELNTQETMDTGT